MLSHYIVIKLRNFNVWGYWNWKYKFYRNKTLIFSNDVDIEKVLVSNKIFLVKKTVSTLLVTCIMILKLYIMLPKTSAYVKGYDGKTKWMYILIEDDDLLKKYNTIWDKVNAAIKKKLQNFTIKKSQRWTLLLLV